MLAALHKSLPSFPYELLPLIVEYGQPVPYRWTYGAPLSTGLSVSDNRIVCRDNQFRFRRIVSTQTVIDGPKRWTVLRTCDADPRLINSFMSVGITAAVDGQAAEYKAFIVATIEADGNSIDQVNVSDEDRNILQSDRPTGKPYRVSLEANPTRRTLRVSIADENGRLLEDRFGQTMDRILQVPAHICRNINTWRPCVDVGGYVTATVLSCADKPAATVKKTFWQKLRSFIL